MIVGIMGDEVYTRKKMNETNIDNIEKWTEEILYFTKKSSLYEEYDGNRYIKLISMADNTKEEKVVQGLMRCIEYDLPGMDECIFDTLSTIEPSIYYTSLFKLLPEIICSVDGRFHFMWILIQQRIVNSYSKDIWEKIYNLGKEYLSKKDLEKIILAYKEDGLDCNDEKDGYTQFYKLFQKLLKGEENAIYV